MPLSSEALGYIDAIKAEIDPIKAEFTAEDMMEVDRVLTACLIVLDDECELGQTDVRRQLSRLDNSYGCWLDRIDAAIRNAALPDEQQRWMIYGAFCMAKSYIFEIEGYNAHYMPGSERAPGKNSAAATFGSHEGEPQGGYRLRLQGRFDGQGRPFMAEKQGKCDTG